MTLRCARCHQVNASCEYYTVKTIVLCAMCRDQIILEDQIRREEFGKLTTS